MCSPGVRSWKTWKFVIAWTAPFLLLPLITSEKESRCAYAMLLLSIFWILEPVHISVTALLPIPLFPLLGIMSSSEVAANYMKDYFLVFIGGLIMAIAIENCKLHERVAYKVLLLIGTDVKWLIFGFMLLSMFFSMWMSTTATTAMLVPIVEYIVEQIISILQLEDSAKSDNVNGDIPLSETNKECNSEENISIEINSNREIGLERTASSLRTVSLLSICYAANIGGTGTPIGTSTNMVFIGLLENLFPGSDEITFLSWMMYNVPGILLCILIGWIYLQLYIVYICRLNMPRSSQWKGHVRGILLNRYEALGPLRFPEKAVGVLYIALVLLWIFRDPKFIPGWSTVFPSDKKISNSVPAMAVCFLLFLIPSEPRNIPHSPPLLSWKTAQQKLPWGIIFLIGGGISLSDGAKKTGLSVAVGKRLESLAVLPPGAIVVVICFMSASVTEIVSNSVTSNILIPVISQLAVSIGVNPLLLMLPLTIASSYAFMLPIASPSNAIVFDKGRMKIADMAKPGIVMNLLCCCVQILMINTLGVAMFGLHDFPSWANISHFKDSLQTLSFNASSDTNATLVHLIKNTTDS